MVRKERERGAAAVEFALVVPILIALVLGIAEFGRAYNIQTTLSNAARDGVRVMALQDDAAAARARVENSALPLDLDDGMIEVLPTSCESGGGASSNTATVTINYPFEVLTGILPFGDFTLTGKGSMRCTG